jgi:hypothetical protein
MKKKRLVKELADHIEIHLDLLVLHMIKARLHLQVEYI